MPMDTAAILCADTRCTDCLRADIRRERRGTRPVVVARALRDAGQAAATSAHPDDRARVEAAIRSLAASGKPFSANDARALHGVRGGVVGAAFTALHKAGVIAACGDETSTSEQTHGHRIYMWVGTNRLEVAA